MSGAPIISGIIQLARPDERRHHRAEDHHQAVHGGHLVEELWLDEPQARFGLPARITTENAAPTITIVNANSRYRCRCPLWLVEKNQRSKKPGLWSVVAGGRRRRDAWRTCPTRTRVRVAVSRAGPAGVGSGRRGRWPPVVRSARRARAHGAAAGAGGSGRLRLPRRRADPRAWSPLSPPPA